MRGKNIAYDSTDLLRSIQRWHLHILLLKQHLWAIKSLLRISGELTGRRSRSTSTMELVGIVHACLQIAVQARGCDEKNANRRDVSNGSELPLRSSFLSYVFSSSSLKFPSLFIVQINQCPVRLKEPIL